MNSKSTRSPAGKPEIQATSACPCDSPAVANCSIQLCQFAEKSFPRHLCALSVARGWQGIAHFIGARQDRKEMRLAGGVSVCKLRRYRLAPPLLDASERATLRLR